MKKALSLAILFALPIFGAEVTEKVCGTNDENENACLTYTFKMPDYPYPWLNAFALQTNFTDPNIKPESANLKQLVTKAAIADLRYSYEKSEKTNEWQPATEDDRYIVIARDESGDNGGVHGYFERSYYVFDKQIRRPITVDNLLLPGVTKQTISPIVEKSYAQWWIKRGWAVNIHEALLSVRSIRGEDIFPVTDNWLITQGGIVFSYPTYEIGPYAFGQVSLVVPVEELEGLIDPDVLAAARRWKTPFVDISE